VFTQPACAAAGRVLEVLDAMNAAKVDKREPVLLRDKATNEITGAAPKYVELVRNQCSPTAEWKLTFAQAAKVQSLLVPASDVISSEPEKRDRRQSKTRRDVNFDGSGSANSTPTRKRGSESEGTDSSTGSSGGKDLTRQRSLKKLSSDEIDRDTERPRS